MHEYLRQSTTSSRNVGPFVDDTDFKTSETALTIANTDIKLSKNGGASVDKNSGGGTHRANGMYSLTFNATDTDTVGELSGSISVAGALIVTFKFTVLEESVYDNMFASAAVGPLTAAQVNTEADTAISDAALATAAAVADVPTVAEFNARTLLAADYFDPAADTVANVTTVATLTGHTAQTGDSFARLGVAGAGLTNLGGSGNNWNTVVPLDAAATESEVNDALVALHLDHLLAVDYDPAAKPGVATALFNELIESDAGVSRYTANALEQAPTGGSAPTVAQIADGVWDELHSGHTVSGSFGEVNNNGANSILAKVGTHAAGSIAAAIGSPTGASLAADIIIVDANVDAILVDTAEIGAAGAGLTAIPTQDANVTEWLGTAVATPTVAGVPETDGTHINGTPINPSAVPDVNLIQIGGNATPAEEMGRFYNALQSGIAQSVTANTLRLAAGAVNADNDYDNAFCKIVEATTGANQPPRKIISSTSIDDVVTLDANWDITPTGTIRYQIIGYTAP